MVRRHPLSASLPTAWLLTDERLSLPVERVAAALPPGSGIVLRHDRLAPGARWRSTSIRGRPAIRCATARWTNRWR